MMPLWWDFQLSGSVRPEGTLLTHQLSQAGCVPRNKHVNKSSIYDDPHPAPTRPCFPPQWPRSPDWFWSLPQGLVPPISLLNFQASPERTGSHSVAINALQPECPDPPSLLGSLQPPGVLGIPEDWALSLGASQGLLQVGTLPSVENNSTLWSVKPQAEPGSIVLRLENDLSNPEKRTYPQSLGAVWSCFVQGHTVASCGPCTHLLIPSGSLLPSLVGRITAPRDVHTLIRRTCGYVMLQHKGKLRLQKEFKVIILKSTLKPGHFILYYLGRSNVIPRVLKCGGGRQKVRVTSNEKNLTTVADSEEGRKGAVSHGVWAASRSW